MGAAGERGAIRERIAPLALVLLALIGCNAATTILVGARGLSFMAGPVGVALQIPSALALAAACRVVLVRVKGLALEHTGLVPRRALALEIALGCAIGVAAVAVLVLAVGLGGMAAIERTDPGPSAAVLACAVLSFVVNAALQQLGLIAVALAAGKDGRPSGGAIALAIGFFVLVHAPESVAPLYLVNVGLFAALCLGLFFARAPRSYGLAIGLHGGVNVALLAAGAFPALEGSEALAVLQLRPQGVLLSGGRAGLESGLAYSVWLLALAALASSVLRSKRVSSPP